MKKIVLILIIITIISLSGCIGVKKINYNGTNSDIKECYDKQWDFHKESGDLDDYKREVAKCDALETLESYNFTLKEMKEKDLIQGEIAGSMFLFIGGSIYGKVEEKMYLVVTYFDPRIDAYKITKFNLEEIQIKTIPKKEIPYFKYRAIQPKYDWNDYTTYPVLYLPEGWSII